MSQKVADTKKLQAPIKPSKAPETVSVAGLGAALSRLGSPPVEVESPAPKRPSPKPQSTPTLVAAKLQEQRPRPASIPGPTGSTTWGLAALATADASSETVDISTPPEESEFSQHTETVQEHLEIFDNPDNPEEGDQLVSESDFQEVAEGNYDQEALRSDLEAQGLSEDEIDQTLEEIDEAAQYFVDSDTHRNALDAADGERDGLVSDEGVEEQVARSQAYDEAVARYEELDEVQDPQQAVAILRDFGQLADTADGEGGADQEIGRDDLQAILEDPNTPASLKAAATYLLDDANEVIFNAVDGAGSEGNANGKLTFYNLDEASSRFENLDESRPPVETTLDAAAVLADYSYLADAASGGGSGASDGEVSFSDLENLAQSEAVPEHVREAAQHFLDLHESHPERLLALRPEFSTSPIHLGHLQAFNSAPEALREALSEHGPSITDGFLRIEDGRPVWSDTGEALTAEQYSALQTQWKEQIEDLDSIQLISSDFSFDFQEVQEHYQEELGSVSDDLADQTSQIEAETEQFGRFIAEYGGTLSPEQTAELTRKHEARLAELQAPLEEQAAEFVELAEDPVFQEAFRNFSDEEKEEFFATVADSVGNTEAGQEFADSLLSELQTLGEDEDAQGLSPYAEVAQGFVKDGKDAKKFRDAVTVLANRQLLNSGTSGTEAYVSIGRFLYGAEYADEVSSAIRDLSVAAEQGEDAYQAARTALDQQLNSYKGRGPSGAFDFLAAGALAVDALVIHEQGFDALSDPSFALNAAKDVADTVGIVSRVFGAGSGTLRTIGRIGNGFGAVAGAIGLAQGIANGDAAQIASGALSLAGYGLLALGVTGPVGPVLLAAGVVVSFLPALLEEDPYREFAEDRFAEVGLSYDNLQAFPQLSPEAQAEIDRLSEELGLPRSQVAQMAIRAIGTQGGGPDEGSAGATQVRESIDSYLDPLWDIDPIGLDGPQGDDLEAFHDLQDETGLEGEELQALIGYVATESYRDFLDNNPQSDLTLREYMLENLAEIAPSVPAAIDEARAAGILD